jgi:hypothetical protein
MHDGLISESKNSRIEAEECLQPFSCEPRRDDAAMSGKTKYKSESTSMNNTGPTTRPRRCKIRHGSPICGSLAMFAAIPRTY